MSVVVPTRDRPEMLRAALAAIRDQQYPGRVETVVVYDQSEPDESLVGDHPDRPVRVIRNQRTPGLAGARNSGILAAEGTLVAFCDDDDEWLPGKLTAQLAAFAEQPAAELVSCGILVRYRDRDVPRTLPWRRVPLAALLRSRLTELHPSTFLFRRSALLDGVGLVDEEIPGSYAEDYELLLRAARRHDLGNVPEPLVAVRWHEQSYFAQRWQTIATALQWLLARYPEFAGERRGEARVTGQIAFATAASGQRRAAFGWATRTLRRHLREPRAWLALAVSIRLLRPDAVVRAAHRRGRGI
ncbi:glycosyltransferase family 2 protein [Natronosporangium hydrolyticum]|uniref:Glycosyltransferase family 2 protein n=1 Tax=Natronosporangium hydrolyticum TaxID=2811111 RepID=A0A895YK78_9ACTN|nr:glycosyltransferase family 2 protein [Natronosporangium hydrolyticum]